jgi:hypothetical protein
MDVSFVARLPKFADFELICGDSIYPCNLHFLKLTSQRLRDLPTSKSFSLPSLTSTNLHPTSDIISDLINFLYGQEILIPPENVIPLFVYGSLLDIPSLIELGTDAQIDISLASQIALNCLRAGHSADFLFRPPLAIRTLKDLPNYSWYSKLADSTEELVRRKENPEVVQEIFRILLLSPNPILLPTLWNLAITPDMYTRLQLIFEAPEIDLRSCPRMQHALASATSAPATFSNAAYLNKMAKERNVECKQAVLEMLTGMPYEKQKSPSFEITLKDTIMQILEYRVRGLEGSPYQIEWKLEGTMNGKVWFIVDQKRREPEPEGHNEKVIRLKHLSPPLKAIRFTQLENSDRSDKVSMRSFEISEGTVRPARFGKT